MSMIYDQIRHAFQSAPRPADDDIAPHDCEECADIRGFFARQTQFDVDAEQLELRTASLSLFTGTAFVYWLPAFMLAELNDTDDFSHTFADWIAWKFSQRSDGGDRTGLLSNEQAKAVAAFLDECARRYPTPEYSADFAAASAHVRHVHRLGPKDGELCDGPVSGRQARTRWE